MDFLILFVHVEIDNYPVDGGLNCIDFLPSFSSQLTASSTMELSQTPQLSSVYFSGDPSSVSLPYLAKISADLYKRKKVSSGVELQERGLKEQRDVDNNANTNEEVIEVGADRFSIHQAPTPTGDSQNNIGSNKKTICVAICGTSSPLQHIMNVMPHAYQGIYAVGRAFSTKEVNNTSSNTTTSRSSTTVQEDVFASHEEAYEAGHREGWTGPARAICQELVRRLGGDNAREFDWNNQYDRIFVTGHSRGGLLAYHVSLLLTRGGNYSEYPEITPFHGILKVVGFGMPPPLSEPTGAADLAFIAENVVSIWNRNDPVANGSILTCRKWNPIGVQVGALKRPKKPKQQKPSSIRGGSGFWGMVGNVVSTAVEAVGDKATELGSDIDKYHTVEEYVRSVSKVDPKEDTSLGTTYLLPPCVVTRFDPNTTSIGGNDNKKLVLLL